ncbi:restriction endonuclease [Acinetobacter gerneri]|uniref:restriction endonuclease n=1 Tax=Acinetobacter gerneri TaxID=202952 RepID=UPI003213CE6A
MFEVENFNQVFQMTLPLEAADQILSQMENAYGSGFDKKFGHINADELRNQVCAVLNGITPKQLQNGLEQLNHQPWCPSLPEFRTWCEGAQENLFWTANHAWAKATTYLDYPKTPITEFTKSALDAVRLILQNEGQKSASYAFRDIYNDLVNEAKARGQIQQMWDRKKELPPPPEFVSISKAEQAMSESDKQICSRQLELMSQGISPKDARKQAQLEIKATKPALINKAQDKSVLIELKSEPVLTPFQKMIAEGKTAAEAFKLCRGATA